jgi:hypothetical protein
MILNFQFSMGTCFHCLESGKEIIVILTQSAGYNEGNRYFVL